MASLIVIQAIRDELDNDPAGIGYTAAPNPVDNEADAIADSALLNLVNRTANVDTLSGSQIFEAIDEGEWDLLNANDQEKIRFVVSLGDSIIIKPGSKARGFLSSALIVSPISLAALGVVSTISISRAAELNFGRVVTGDIQHARILP